MEREGEAGLIVGGWRQGRRTGRVGTTTCLTLLPEPEEEGYSQEDDDGGARQDHIHVANVEPLQVDRVQGAP